MSGSVTLFYYLQNERGETAAHPNALRVPVPSGGRATLRDVLDAWPLAGTGSFHFRFSVTVEGGSAWLDVLDVNEALPFAAGGSHLVAKVLRLGACRRRAAAACRCAAGCAQRAPLPVSRARGPPPSPSLFAPPPPPPPRCALARQTC